MILKYIEINLLLKVLEFDLRMDSPNLGSIPKIIIRSFMVFIDHSWTERFPGREGGERTLAPGTRPNRGRLHPRELYALIHVIVSDTNIQVYLHNKN